MVSVEERDVVGYHAKHISVLLSYTQCSLPRFLMSVWFGRMQFSRYFDECPVLNVPGRCFPVNIAHTLEQPDSYAEVRSLVHKSWPVKSAPDITKHIQC